jgi:hypothetical protein
MFSFLPVGYEPREGAKENIQSIKKEKHMNNEPHKHHNLAPKSKVRKCYKTLPVATDDDDLRDIDTFRQQVPFSPSRSRFAQSLVRYGMDMLRQEKVSVELLGSKYSEDSAISLGHNQ